MPLRERITSVEKERSWKDEIPFHYEYTAGVSGERFLRGLQAGKILASRCRKCKRAYLPPKAYCVDCYLPIADYFDVGAVGRVAALAETEEDLQGNKLKKPRVFAFVVFDGVTGGLVHRVSGKGVVVGSKVAAKFRQKKERKGDILDIEEFVAQSDVKVSHPR
jgi:uncharacterized protein